MEFTFTKNDIICVTDTIETSFFIQQIAANVIFTMERYNYDKEYNYVNFNTETPSGTLKQYRNWAQHGYLNAFHPQVNYIYSFLCAIKTKDQALTHITLLENNGLSMLLTALTTYQIAKTSWISKEKQSFGEHWGNATGYNKMNWSDQNERILELMDFPKDHEFWKVFKTLENPHGN